MDSVIQSPESSAYGADQIKVLEGLDPVRKRPGMYIGDTAERGLHHLVYEVVDNSVDEALAGFCKRVSVIIHVDCAVTVEDDGRGIPVDIHPTEGMSAAEVVMTKLHAGGKFDKDVYKVSGGLHGVGVSVVNALSEHLELEIWRDGFVHFQRYRRGQPEAPLARVGATHKRGTKVTFKADPLIFPVIEFSFEILSQRLRELAFLNRGLLITIEDQRSGRQHEFHYPGGIVSFVEYLNSTKTPLHNEAILIEGERDGVATEVALQWNDGYIETVYTFANNINTGEGGTHLSGFKAALTRTINAYAQSAGLLKKEGEALDGEDVREGVTAVIAVKVPEPQFEGQTKTKLGNSEVKGLVEALVNEKLGNYFEEHPGEARKIVAKCVEAARVPRGDAQGQGPRPSQGRARLGLASREARRLPGARPEAVRAVHRRGRLRRWLGQAGSRAPESGDSTAAWQDPERREGALRQDALLAGDSPADHGARDGHRQGRQGHLEAALPHAHHHDGRGRRREPHPDPVADVLLSPVSRAHRERPRPDRAAAAVQGQEGQSRAVSARRRRPRELPHPAR
jgi:hypothetical protein